ELLDRDKASNIDIHNKRKIIRAIEVAQFESATPIDKNKQSEHSVRYNLVLIGLTMNRDVLYQKIDARVDKMVDQGLIEETQRLLENYDPSMPSMTGIGYAEIAEYLNGRMSKVEAVQKMKWRIHAYVRRQYTWFNKQKVHWVSIENKEWQNEIDSLVQKYMY